VAPQQNFIQNSANGTIAGGPQHNGQQQNISANILVDRHSFNSGAGGAQKKHLLRLLSIHYGKYVPPASMAPVSFLRDVLAGRKMLLVRDQVLLMQNIERYSALDIQHVWSWAIERQIQFQAFIPSGLMVKRLSK
jgi:hypothetical protein